LDSTLIVYREDGEDDADDNADDDDAGVILNSTNGAARFLFILV